VLLFAGLSVAWGIPYLLIEIAVVELSPSSLALARTAVAAARLLPVAVVRGWGVPVLRGLPRSRWSCSARRLGPPCWIGGSATGFLLVVAGSVLVNARRRVGRSAPAP
jgi:hypothetical protein